LEKHKLMATKAPPAELIKLLQSALQHQKDGQDAKADSLYRTVLKSYAAYPDAVQMAALFFYNSGKTKLAIKALSKAVKKSPARADMHKTLAMAYFEEKDYDRAEKHLNSANNLNPGEAETLLYLGKVAHKHANHEAALAYYSASLKHKKTYEAYLGYADILIGYTKLDEALSTLLKMRKEGFDSVDIHLRLGVCYHYKGMENECLNEFFIGLRKDPDNRDIVIHLGFAISDGIIPNYTPEIQDDILLCLRAPSSDPRKFYKAWKALLEDNPLAKQLDTLQKAKSFAEFSKLFDKSEYQSALFNPLFIEGLARLIINDLTLEKTLTFARRYCLENIKNIEENDSKNEQDALAFLCALAQNCFFTEYVFDSTEEEEKALDALPKESVYNALIYGCYRPLLGSDFEDAILNADGQKQKYLTPIIKEQITNPREEQKIKKTIKPIRDIVDDVSAKVRDQYEENPYPRWKNTSLFTAFYEQYADEALIKPRDILIAGCGTGQQIVNIYNKYKNAKITAIDLSAASLAYAIRQSKEHGIKDIKFLQGDILDAELLNKKFDEVHCTGVLHHMKDPMKGWRILTNLVKARGIMKIALYSQLARQDVTTARKLITDQEFKPTLQGIRQCRAYIRSLPDNHPVKPVTKRRDFYAASECRDLVFHVQEHLFTIPKIKACLSELNLDFMGFQHKNYQWNTLYGQKYPDDPQKLNLDNWQSLEEAHPSMFAGMYQFFVKKPA